MDPITIGHDAAALRVFERKVLGKIFSPVRVGFEHPRLEESVMCQKLMVGCIIKIMLLYKKFYVKSSVQCELSANIRDWSNIELRWSQ